MARQYKKLPGAQGSVFGRNPTRPASTSPSGIAARPLVFPPPHSVGRDVLGSERLAHVSWVRPVLPVGRGLWVHEAPGEGQTAPICWVQCRVQGVCLDLASGGGQTG